LALLLGVAGHLAISAHAVRAELPLITNYTATEENLGRGIWWDIAQDKDGVLYFASTSLLRFDGERFTSFTLPNAFAIRRLHFGPDGKIWAAATTDLGWFERNDREQWDFHSLRHKLPVTEEPLTELWGVSADAAGTTFVAQDKILRWNGAEFKVWKKASERRLTGMHANGRFFVHALAEGIFEVDADGPRMLLPRGLLPNALVVWLERFRDGWLLGTGAGLFQVTDAGEIRPYSPGIASFLVQHRLTSIARLQDGRLAIGSVSGGLALLSAEGEMEGVYDVSSGLPSNFVVTLRVGREGELWAGTGGGVVSLNPNSQTALFDERVGLPRGSYRRLAKFGDAIVVAGEPSLYTRGPNDDVFRVMPGTTGRWQELRETPAGLLLAGPRGLWRLTQTGFTPVYPSEYDVFTSVESRRVPGEIFLSDNRSIVAITSAGVRRQVVENISDNAPSLAEDAGGHLWLGTLSSGVLVAEPRDEFAVEASPPAAGRGLPSGFQGQTFVHAFSDGSVLVLADSGAWIKRADSEIFDPVKDYPARALAAVATTSLRNSLWLAHTNSPGHSAVVGRVLLTQAGAFWQPHAVDELAKVGAIRSILAEDDTVGDITVWIGGNRAVLRHRVGQTLATPGPSAPLVHAFASGATGARQPVRGDLPYTTRRIEFEFAAPQYTRRPQLRIESRIDGIDTEWIRDEGDSVRVLTALREGSYLIRVRAVAETGQASPEKTVSFRVLRPWWRTMPTLSGFFIAIAVTAAGIARWRTRQLQRRTVELEKKVRDRTVELEHANAAKTDFVANISHDIRNPLNGVVGLALALENTRLDPSQREMLATLRECSMYLSSLVDDVLDFASIEAGKVELRPEPFAPADVLNSVAVTMQALAKERAARLQVQVDPMLPALVMGDAGRVQQILVNFVSNALKYAGGEIQLVASRPNATSDELELSVIDAGVGLTAAEQAKLFTKFTRLERDRIIRVPGTGLGLAACRLLADMMGGAVGVTSAPGAGSCFWLRLPLHAATPANVAPVTLPNRTVLVVEDADYNAWAATAVLAKLGLSCERARTGEEALRLFAEKRFNVVMLDCNLPDIDGFEVARRIRQHENGAAPSLLLAVTAYCTAEDRARCLAAGMDAFLGKPITPEKIRRVLIEAGSKLRAAPMAELVDDSTRPANLALLAFLSDGTPEGIGEQVDRFVSTLETDYAEALAAKRRENFELIARQAHRLHGQAKFVGDAPLASACQRLEASAAAGSAADCQSGLTEVAREIGRLTAALHRAQPAEMSG